MKFLKSQGLLLIISSPSGAGKSSLAGELVKLDPNMSFSVSFTTREKRPGEVEGKDYYFVDIKSFKMLIEKGEMLEHAKVFGNYYGTPKAAVGKNLSKGKDVVFDVDWQGSDKIRESKFSKNVISIFILPPSILELEKRLLARRQDSVETVSNRMSEAKNEIEQWTKYDYVLVNNKFEDTLADIKAVVKAKRLELHRNSNLQSFVKCLNEEFEQRGRII